MSIEWWSLFGGGRTTFDPPPLWQSWSCNCACQVCMAGDCCMRPGRTTPETYVSTGTAPLLPAHVHTYQRFDATRLFCQTCGETKRVR